MKSINSLLQEIKKNIKEWDAANTSISSASSYRHIVHSLSAIQGIIQSLQSSDPAQYHWRFNPMRLLVLTTWWIPRWRAESPPHLKEFGEISSERLLDMLTQTINILPLLDMLDSHHFFDHSTFGRLDLRTTKKFITGSFIICNKELSMRCCFTNSWYPLWSWGDDVYFPSSPSLQIVVFTYLVERIMSDI